VKARISPLRRRIDAAGVRVPGDKSISHRALMLAALAKGESRIGGLAPGNDVRSTARCLSKLGVKLARGEGDPGMGPDDAIVVGQGRRGLREPNGPLDCGNSGTSLRLLTGICAGAGLEATLMGDESLSRRPMERVAAPLREMGAVVETASNGRPPVTVRRGHPLHPARIETKVASAQVKSAVLLAGMFIDGETIFSEPARSRDHTERMLRTLGADLRVQGSTVTLRGPAELPGFALEVPGDLSSAAFLIAAALVAPEGGSLQIEHVGVNPTRTGFLDALALFGARLKLELGGQSKAAEPTARLTASGQKLKGAHLDGELILRSIDEVPILAVLGALAEGETVIRGAAELRIKESDRLAQMAAGLRAMGAKVEELPDGLRIEGAGSLPGGVQIDSAMDHRIALAFSVAALAAEKPTTIAGAEWADVSFPGFFALLQRLGAEVEILA